MALPTPVRILRRYKVVIPIQPNFNLDIDTKNIFLGSYPYLMRKTVARRRKLKETQFLDYINFQIQIWAINIGNRLPFNVAFSLAFAYHRAGFNKVFMLENTAGIMSSLFTIDAIKEDIAYYRGDKKLVLDKFRIHNWPSGSTCPNFSSLRLITFDRHKLDAYFKARLDEEKQKSLEITTIQARLKELLNLNYAASLPTIEECKLLTSIGAGDFLFYNDVTPTRSLYLKFIEKQR